MDKVLADKLRAYDQKVYNSFSRSHDRIIVIVDINKKGESSAGEISTRTGIDYVNVRGALIGDDKKYSIKASLVGLELAMARLGQKATVYTLTEKGKKVADLIDPGQIVRKP